MPVARRNTPPTSQIKAQLGVLNSLSAWTDTGEDEEVNKRKKQNAYVLAHPTEDGEAVADTEKVKGILDPESDRFNIIIGIVIMSNAITIGLETELGNEHFAVFEHLFNSCFFIEMVLRVRSLGGSYFKEAWNLFDFFLVMSGTLDLWILPLFTAGGSSALYHLSAMRMLRILRLMRILRVVRLFRMFHQLYLIMQAFNKAFQIVLLMGLLVFILDYVCAIMLTQAVGKNATSWGASDEELITMWFGSIPNSMQTLFLIMTLSGWGEISMVLTKVVPSPLVYGGLVLYIMVTSYTMLSLITGIISESLITSQQEYRLRKERSQEESKKEISFELRQFLFDTLEDDKDQNNNVKPEDIKTAIRGDTELLMKLAAIGMKVDEAGVLSLIDKLSNDGSVMVNIDYFVDKLTNLNGPATSSSVMDLKFELYKVHVKLDAILKKLDIPDPFPNAELAS